MDEYRREAVVYFIVVILNFASKVGDLALTDKIPKSASGLENDVWKGLSYVVILNFASKVGDLRKQERDL